MGIKGECIGIYFEEIIYLEYKLFIYVASIWHGKCENCQAIFRIGLPSVESKCTNAKMKIEEESIDELRYPDKSMSEFTIILDDGYEIFK